MNLQELQNKGQLDTTREQGSNSLAVTRQAGENQMSVQGLHNAGAISQILAQSKGQQELAAFEGKDKVNLAHANYYNSTAEENRGLKSARERMANAQAAGEELKNAEMPRLRATMDENALQNSLKTYQEVRNAGGTGDEIQYNRDRMAFALAEGARKEQPVWGTSMLQTSSTGPVEASVVPPPVTVSSSPAAPTDPTAERAPAYKLARRGARGLWAGAMLPAVAAIDTVNKPANSVNTFFGGDEGYFKTTNTKNLLDWFNR
jgi:hypothetical protein